LLYDALSITRHQAYSEPLFTIPSLCKKAFIVKSKVKLIHFFSILGSHPRFQLAAQYPNPKR